MTPDIGALAQGAGSTVVTLMATDAWHTTRAALTRWWQRFQPHRAESAVAALDESRTDAVTARDAGDQEALGELRAEWQGRFRRLIAANPEAAEELRRLLDEVAPQRPAAEAAVTQEARAAGRARIYQAGRDQHITER